jgi:hypothetical protein
LEQVRRVGEGPLDGGGRVEAEGGEEEEGEMLGRIRRSGKEK